MTIEPHPGQRIADLRFDLLTRRGHSATTESECVLDALLTGLGAAVAPGAGKILTRNQVAGIVGTAFEEGHDRAEQAGVAHSTVTCSCGHLWTDHVSLRGCFECGCTERRPIAVQLAPVPVPEPVPVDDQAPVHAGEPVTVHAAGSRYDGREGAAVVPDLDGGFAVEIPGEPDLIHFELAELTPRRRTMAAIGGMDA